MVYELTESGFWSHNHMNPLHLQLEEPEHIPGDEENQTFISAMKAFGNYLQSEDEEKVMKGQAVVQTAREYAEIKRCKKWKTKNLNEAMSQKILCLEGVLLIITFRFAVTDRLEVIVYGKNDKRNLYMTDCGCGFEKGRLGCLCLETKEEFYV